MSLHPRNPTDLMLAPVAVQIDRNLQRMRDVSARQVEVELELELDLPANDGDRDVRVELVLRHALRDVDLDGWNAAITDDGSRLHLRGGSVTVDIGLSAGITRYIEEGVPEMSVAHAYQGS